ncbi:MAG: TolC family protein [Candidatus Omnitrophica bacterium]|nr:TolC family protein [Candidatus Omnitrophota bacterium]
MRKIILFIYLLNTSLLWAEEGIKLTLEEAINIALRDNREILLKKEDFKKAKEKLKEAEAGILPILSLGSSWSDTRDYYSKDVTNFINQFSVKQPLYKGGKISGEIEENKYKIEASQTTLNMSILEIVFNVKRAFLTLMLAKEYAQLNELILRNTKNHLKAITERYDKGEVSESELIKLQEALTNIEHIFNISINQIENAKANLKNILYLANDVEIEPQGEFLYEPIEVAFDEVYLKALSKRPELRLYEEKINRIKREIAKAELLPNVYASWDYYLNRSDSPLAVSQDWESHQIVGVVITWPIFDGFATQAKIRQAELDLKENQLRKEKTTADITLELKNACLELNDAISKLKAKDAEMKFYEDNLRVIRDKYRVGIASDLDLEDAELRFEIANFNRKEGVYDYLIAKAKLEKAMGEVK